MFEERRQAEWEQLNTTIEQYNVSDLKDGRVEILIIDAEIDWERGRERKAIRKLRRALDILQENIVLELTHRHIWDGISDTSESEKIHEMEKKYNILMSRGKLSSARRILDKLSNDPDVAIRSGGIMLHLETDDECGIIAIVRNEMDEPITIREIKLLSSGGDNRPIYSGLTTIDSRSVESFLLSSDSRAKMDVLVYYERDGKSYTLSSGGADYGC